MKKSPLLWQSALSSLGVLAYVALISWVLWHGEDMFGQFDSFVGPMLMLMLLVFSVTVVGLLVFGRPVYLFLTGMKKEAIELVLYTVAWLFVVTVIMIVTLSST